MKMQFLVLGARMFNDTVDGQKHDFTKLAVVMDFPDSNKNAVGQNSVELNWGTHENFHSIKDLQYPCQFELDVNPTTKGLELVSAKPLTAKVSSVG